MANKLIIVESPTKVHTIKKFLGAGYEVTASQGHIRDLPKSSLGVDIENDFEPKYITIRGKGELVSELKKEIRKADKIYLATDPDREGEAISWHLREALPMDGKQVYRITFNEITKAAVKEALKKPRELDMNLVNAQQARRVLDRVVGYQLSPILWKKVKGKLSAGRVQSAVLRMISDREEEIANFIPEEYWNFSAVLQIPGGSQTITADYYGDASGKKKLGSEADVKELEKAIHGKKFQVTEIKKASRVSRPPYPFTTSTLQQDASSRLNFTTQKTMSVAQQLYEGMKITGHGTVGLITYLRTDSTRISKEADAACKGFIREHFGDELVGKGMQKEGTGNVQDAHEAIRPADVNLTPDLVKADLPRDAYRLYLLIWNRFVASRMKSASYDTLSAKMTAGDRVFTASASSLAFKGYLAVYDTKEDKKSGERSVSALSEGMELSETEIKKEQHFTQPPDHYTEASLVRTMEEKGIGRPSTYAPTITNILAKHYITKEGRSIFVTELGEVVNGIMEHSFPDIVDLGFTAEMEKQLDEVEHGTKDWRVLMRDFYPNFEEELKRAEKELERVKVEDEKTDIICEECGRNMVIKYGRHGKFLACPGFPECRNTKPFLEKAGVPCPKCGKDLVVRRTKKGRRFYACEGAPECDYMSWNKPKSEKPEEK